jgi:predicted ATPase/predicted negative regulator of RcsB-dependent stress response
MVFLFTEIDHPRAFKETGTTEADHILSSQYFLIEQILYAHGVHWMQRVPTGVLGIFKEGEPAKAAIALQKEFQNHSWESFGKAGLRVAIHVGEAEPLGQNYFGPDFNHARKLLEAARGSQILLTVPAVHFVPLPPGARLQDMGTHFLKDLSEPQNIYVLVHSDFTPEAIHPPVSLQNYPQNLLPQGSPFFGREEEMGEIEKLLLHSSTRLVTLLGPGGFGKTRLALQAAADLIEEFEEGVYMIALAPLLSDQLMVGSIASAIKFFFYGVEDPRTQLLNHLNEKHMLLLMDNFEHIIEGSELVEQMLKAAPRLKIMITSRESLGIDGEKVLEVKGLRYPAEGRTEGMEASSAVQLFVKSAHRIQPDFSLVPEDREALLKICRLLEGMPLGLELSATWVPTLSLSQIAEKIESSRDFLATSMPHLPPRHRSLRAVFEYSWILLSEPQKKVLRGISVFRGSFTEQAARKVAGATESLLLYLSNKSLLRVRSNGRFEIHELLKYYAKEKLFDDPAEKEKAFNAHCFYYAELTGKKVGSLYGPGQKKAIEDLTEEIGNIREGWKRALEQLREPEIDSYLGSLFFLFETKGWFQEAQENFKTAVEGLVRKYAEVSPVPKSARVFLARLKALSGFFENLLGRPETAQKLFEESLRLYQSAQALKKAGFAFSGLGIVNETQGHYAKAKDCYGKGYEAYHQVRDHYGLVWSLNNLGHIENRLGHLSRARALVRKSLAYSLADKDVRSRAYSYNLMGDILHDEGRFEEARVHYQKGLSAYLEISDRKGIAWSFNSLGHEAFILGDYSGARQMFREGMAISKDLGDSRAVAWAECLLGQVCWAKGEYPEAFKLYDEALALYHHLGDIRGEALIWDLVGNLQLAQKNDHDAEIAYQRAYDLLAGEGLDPQNKAWHQFHQGTLSSFRGDHKQAKSDFLKSLHNFERRREPIGQTVSLIRLGEVACRQKAPAEAHRYFQKAIRLALDSRLFPFLVDGLIGIAQLLKDEGDERQAVSFLLAALNHPTCRQEAKDRIVAFSMELQSHFSSQEVEGAIQWAKASRIEEVAAAWLSSRKGARSVSRNHSKKRKVAKKSKLKKANKK